MKNINLIITGGIAASKAKQLYNLLIKKYNVNIILTKNAHKFVDFKNCDYTDQIFNQEFYDDNHTFGDHLKLACVADLNIVYPATYNYIGKIANGIADDMPSLLFAAAKMPFFLFPSMNFNMYENSIFKKNKEILKKLYNVKWINAKVGKMASRHIGIGRALEPGEVYDIINNHFNEFYKFSNKKLLINFGKTRSWIDTVRYITNASSGRMGTAIKNNAKFFFNDVISVFGDNDVDLVQDENNFYAETNEQMLEIMKKYFEYFDVIICSAALYDYESKKTFNKKLEKQGNKELNINLIESIDVLKELGKIKKNQFLVGFSLMDQFDINKAWKKVKQKNLDMIIINLTTAMGSFENEVKILISKTKEVINIKHNSKEKIAIDILKKIHDNI